MKVDQVCPSCGTDIHCEGEVEKVVGTGLMREIAAEWECPSCGVEHHHEHPFDMDLMDVSGFHSWVGSIGEEPACIVVSDGADVVESAERSAGSTVGEQSEPKEVETDVGGH